MFATNEMPVFGQDNHAIWRRWLYVDFPYTFSARDPDAKDPEPRDVLMDRLTNDAELEALLVRCQQEIQAWHEQRDREWYPDAMDPQEVRQKMKRAAEPVYNFASTCLTEGEDDDYIPKSDVRDCYQEYAREQDLPRIPENEFGERLTGLRDYQIETGRHRIDGERPRCYEGIRLSSRGRQVLGLDEPDADSGQETVTNAADERPNKPLVLERARHMVEENDNEPVSRNALEWAVTDSMGKSKAEHIVDELLKQGDLQRMDDDRVIPT
jgi:phage/plasmid-associated DNA primase